jgi:hypothetical protein
MSLLDIADKVYELDDGLIAAGATK